jgi:hypothetical protein
MAGPTTKTKIYKGTQTLEGNSCVNQQVHDPRAAISRQSKRWCKRCFEQRSAFAAQEY